MWSPGGRDATPITPDYRDFLHDPQPWEDGRLTKDFEEVAMGKTGNKRRARKKKKANHGKRPNS